MRVPQPAMGMNILSVSVIIQFYRVKCVGTRYIVFLLTILHVEFVLSPLDIPATGGDDHYPAIRAGHPADRAQGQRDRYRRARRLLARIRKRGSDGRSSTPRN